MARKFKKRSKLYNLRKPLLGVAALVLVAGAGYWYWLSRDDKQTQTQTPSTATSDEPRTVVATPPTEQDKKAVEEHKDELAQQNSTPPPPPPTSGKKQVSVLITEASKSGTTITVRGYVSGVIEDGGTCTLTLSKGSTQYTQTAEGFADATTSTCPPISLSKSAFSSGGWSAVLSYSSNSSSGTSNSQAVN